MRFYVFGRNAGGGGGAVVFSVITSGAHMSLRLIIGLGCLDVSVDALARAAITKHHRLGGLNHRHLVLVILEAEKSKVKVLVDLFLGEGPCPGRVLTWGKDRLWSLFLFIKTQFSSWRLCPHTLI